jgi:hypothetical protein
MPEIINLYVGEGVHRASSEVYLEPSSGPSNGIVSKIFVSGPEQLTVGTARTYGSGKTRPSPKLKIDPVRGLPPPFLPGNTSTQKISIGSNQANGAPINQYSHLDVANPDGAFCPYIGPQPIEFLGNSGPLVMAPTPRRSVSQTVYNVSPAAANPFSVSHSSGPITPLRLQLARRIWPSPHMAQISPGGAKPTLEVAFDPQNLPFMELGRRSCGVDHGVVRISNVSIPSVIIWGNSVHLMLIRFLTTLLVLKLLLSLDAMPELSMKMMNPST